THSPSSGFVTLVVFLWSTLLFFLSHPASALWLLCVFPLCVCVCVCVCVCMCVCVWFYILSVYFTVSYHFFFVWLVCFYICVCVCMCARVSGLGSNRREEGEACTQLPLSNGASIRAQHTHTHTHKHTTTHTHNLLHTHTHTHT